MASTDVTETTDVAALIGKVVKISWTDSRDITHTITARIERGDHSPNGPWVSMGLHIIDGAGYYRDGQRVTFAADYGTSSITPVHPAEVHDGR